MIIVSNFYSDLLLSLRHIFDNIIFGQKTIKTYEYNIGNRSFQLEYKSQYEMPNCIINFLSADPDQHHHWLIRRSSLGNHSKIPILYDFTKKLSLQLQENYYLVNIEVLLNVESLIQSIEFEHRLKSNLPIGKPLQLHHFYTFYEIPQEFLKPHLFDVNNDKILNLSLKHDPLSDKLIHCAAVRYEPLIKMESCMATGGNSEQRSFQIQCSLTIMIPVPMYFEIPSEELPKEREISEISQTGICVPIYKDIPILCSILKNQEDTFGYKLFFPIFSNDQLFDNDFKYISSDLEEPIIGHISGKLSDISISKGMINFTPNEIILEDTISDYILHEDKKNIQSSLSVKGNIIGNIVNWKFDDSDNISGLLFGKFNGEMINQRISGTYELLNYLNDIEYISITTSLDNYNSTNFVIPYGSLQNSIPNYNPQLINIILEKSKLSKICAIEKSTNTIIIIDINDYFDKYGNFEALIKHKHTINSNLLYYSLRGKFNKKNLTYYCEIVEQQEENDLLIVGLIFDFVFNNIPKYGARYIEKIHLNLTPNRLESILIADTAKYYYDEFQRSLKNKDEHIYRSIIISPDKSELSHYIVKTENSDFILKITFDIPIIDLINEDNVYWRLFFKNDIFEKTSKIFKLLPRTENSNDYILEFSINKDYYYEQLIDLSITTPIIFHLYNRI